MQPDNHKQQLTQKILDRKATVGVIGLGYVGLPLVLRFAEIFESVIGFDIDPEKVKALHEGKSYIRQIPDQRITEVIGKSLLATTEFSKVRDCDVIIICVPTPLTKHFEPDLSYVRITTETIAPFLKEGQLLVLESTTFPGTTEELIAPRVENKGFQIGSNFYLSYSPEREDPGNPTYKTHNIPKVVGGYTKDCLDVACTLYESIIEKIVPVSSTKAAEMTKLLENIHRAVNIGLVNEMKIVADKMGIDIHEVIDAAATKPFGFTKFSPGPGLGGHCIPIDPFYLTWKAKEYGVNTRFIELSGEVNRAMPDWIVEKLTKSLNALGKSVSGSRILILGIAYKKNVDDTRESPAIKIMDILKNLNADVQYSDPHVPVFPGKREYNFQLKSIPITKESIKNFDVLLLTTDHDNFDYQIIEKNAKLVIDTRNKFPKSPNIIKA